MYLLPTVPTKSEAKWNAHAKNHIFEVLDKELFDRVFAFETAHEVLMQLKEIHVGNKKIREEKYELLKVELQVNQVRVKKTRTRRSPVSLSWMMKSLHSHLHLCASWQSTLR
jgi:hypothetical protein